MKNKHYSIILPEGSKAHTIKIEYLMGSYVLSAYTWTAKEGRKLLARQDCEAPFLQRKIMDMAGSVVPRSLLGLIVGQMKGL